MAEILIVYHSGFGHTEKVAHHVGLGANSVDGSTAKLLNVDQAMSDLDGLDQASMLVFGSPTYMGGVSAKFKEFMDATSKKWLKQCWKDKLAAGFTNSGSMSGDKFNVLIQLVTFAAQHGMIWVGNAGGFSTPSAKQPDAMIDRFGSCLGLMTQSDNADVALTPSGLDLESAEFFGKRLAETSLRWSPTKCL